MNPKASEPWCWLTFQTTDNVKGLGTRMGIHILISSWLIMKHCPIQIYSYLILPMTEQSRSFYQSGFTNGETKTWELQINYLKLNIGRTISRFTSFIVLWYPLEKEMATHSSILAWRAPWTEESGRLQSIRSQRVGHDWSNLACTYPSVLFLVHYWSHSAPTISSPYG